MDTNKGFSKILRELREQRNMTQKEVAEALGIERNSYGNYELGNRTPDKTMLIKLANFFDVSADYLLGRFETIQANDNRIPLLGSVPAGSPIEAIEEVEEYIDYYPHFVKHGELFGLRVTGDSMEPDIREGDIAIVPYTEADIKSMLSNTNQSKPYTLPGKRQAKNNLPEGQRLKTTIILLLDTGIRASEFCNLKHRDVDLRNLNIIVMGKGRKERQIPISSRTAQAIWSYFHTRPEMHVNSPAFTTANGTKISRDNLLKSIYRLGNRAGVQDPNLHRFRHTFAINFLRNGGDIYTLQRILGHSTLDMVQRYLAIAQVDIQAAHRRASPVMNWGL